MVERQTTKNCRICDIVSGTFVQGDRDTMRANSVLTQFGESVSRAKVVGVVVEKFQAEDGRFASITIDDGTGAIRARVFENELGMIADYEPGDLVSVVGKVKNFRDETYIAPEMVRSMTDPNAETLFRLEVLNDLIDKKRAADEIRRMRDQMSEEELAEYAMQKYGLDPAALQSVMTGESSAVDYKPLILDVISKLDGGDGVEIAKILEAAGIDQSMAESALSELMENGELYEPVVGKLRRV